MNIITYSKEGLGNIIYAVKMIQLAQLENNFIEIYNSILNGYYKSHGIGIYLNITLIVR